MYATYFGFRCLPFDGIPESDAAFESAAFAGALQDLHGCVEGGAGFALLTGAQGAGKTTVLRALQARLERAGTSVLVNDRDAGWETFVDVALASLGDAAGAPRGDEVTADRDGMTCTAVVLVDDAHELPGHVLRHLPSLVERGADLGARVTVVLAAQPELTARLEDGRLDALRRRLTRVHALGPLAALEVRDYVRHKLDAVGYQGPELFDESAIGCLVARCDGNPKWIDLLCGLALLIAFDSGRRLVDGRIVTEAANDHPGFVTSAPPAVTHEHSGHEAHAAGAPEAEPRASTPGSTTDGRWPASPVFAARARKLLRSLAALARSASTRGREASSAAGAGLRALVATARGSLARLAVRAGAARATLATMRRRRARSRDQANGSRYGRGDTGVARERDLLEVKLAITGVLTVGLLGLGLVVFLVDDPGDGGQAPEDESPRASTAIGRSSQVIARLEEAHEIEVAVLRDEMRRLRLERDEALKGVRTREARRDQDRAELVRLRSELATAELAASSRPVSLTLPAGTFVTFSGPDGERVEVGPDQLEGKGERLVIGARIPQEFIDVLTSLDASDTRGVSGPTSPAPAGLAVSGDSPEAAHGERTRELGPSVSVAGLEPTGPDDSREPGAVADVARADAVQGDAAQGDVVQGEAVQGEVVQGEVVQGEVVQGEVVQGDAVQGDVVQQGDGIEAYAVEADAIQADALRARDAPEEPPAAGGSEVSVAPVLQARARDDGSELVENGDSSERPAEATGGSSAVATQLPARAAPAVDATALAAGATEPSGSAATLAADTAGPAAVSSGLAASPAEPERSTATLGASTSDPALRNATPAVSTAELKAPEPAGRGEKPAARTIPSSGAPSAAPTERARLEDGAVPLDAAPTITPIAAGSVPEPLELEAIRVDPRDGEPREDVRAAEAPRATGATGVEHADYVVVAGDTLTAIGKRFDATVAELREWNGLTSDALRIGQPLNVKSPHGLDRETNRALLAAAGHGQLGLVRALLDAGASPDARDEEGRTALMYAARRGHYMVVRILAERGADIDLRGAVGGTALSDAAWAGHAMVLSELLERGADVDAANEDGWTPLMYASINGHLGCVQALIGRGAQVNARNEELRTALSAAVWNGHVEIVRALLESGAEVDERMDEGWTALMEAAWNGEGEIVALLLEYGADPSAFSDAGLTPASLAEQQGHADIAVVISRSIGSSS